MRVGHKGQGAGRGGVFHPCRKVFPGKFFPESFSRRFLKVRQSKSRQNSGKIPGRANYGKAYFFIIHYS
jgi:hypothetical protein